MVTKEDVLADFGITDTGPGKIFGECAYFFGKGNAKGILILRNGVSYGQVQKMVTTMDLNDSVLTASFAPVETLLTKEITDEFWKSDQLFYLLARGVVYQLGGGELLDIPELMESTGCRMKLISTLGSLKGTIANISTR